MHGGLFACFMGRVKTEVIGIQASPEVKPKSVIRPKHAYYKRICLSFPPFSAFVSSSCRRLRFAIARYGFNTNVASCSKQRRSRVEI